MPLIIWGAIQYPSWVGDNVQRAPTGPTLMFALVGMEQIIRIVLAYLLLERFQINALIIAYFVGLLTKDIVAYFVNHRSASRSVSTSGSRWRRRCWQARPTSGVALGHRPFIWQGDQITSVLIFFIGILLSYPLFAFFYGLFGGWDDETLAELRQRLA